MSNNIKTFAKAKLNHFISMDIERGFSRNLMDMLLFKEGRQGIQLPTKGTNSLNQLSLQVNQVKKWLVDMQNKYVKIP